jgi:hypothetical protein
MVNSNTAITARRPRGKLAKEFCDLTLELQVMQSNAGWYLGTADEEGPVSRESLEYWGSEEKATNALDSGEWNQRETP